MQGRYEAIAAVVMDQSDRTASEPGARELCSDDAWLLSGDIHDEVKLFSAAGVFAGL